MEILREAYYQHISAGTDVGGMTMGVAGGWAGAVSGYAAGAALGLSGVASGGVGFVVGTVIAVGYSLTQEPGQNNSNLLNHGDPNG